MRHGDDGAGDSVGRGCGEDLIEKWNEDGEAFERESLGAEVALLDDLLEEVGADELGEDVGLVGLGAWAARFDPAATGAARGLGMCMNSMAKLPQ